MWITLGTSLEIRGRTGKNEQIFCGKPAFLAYSRGIPYNGTTKTTAGGRNSSRTGLWEGESTMSGKLRIAITADTYPYASEVTNLVDAPFAPRGLVEVQKI